MLGQALRPALTFLFLERFISSWLAPAWLASPSPLPHTPRCYIPLTIWWREQNIGINFFALRFILVLELKPGGFARSLFDVNVFARDYADISRCFSPQQVAPLPNAGSA